jgi:DNA-binding SARP family transcriptional activator
VRDRLTSRLLDPAGYLVGRVVAPAGSGKSRLLAHAALGYPGPVAWCGPPEAIPRTQEALVGWLWGRIGPVLGGADRAPVIVDDLVGCLESSAQPVLVVIDDAHLLEGSDAETALGELVGRMSDRSSDVARLLYGSRVDLALDLSRLRVLGRLIEIGPDDLRFRAWEVEELFRDVYRDPMIPEDVAALARRTGGWAAYLQLFHLATDRKTQSERRRVLASMVSRPRLVQEYLARNVLIGLSDELQDFLIRTSVLRRPSGPLCDELLGWSSGSDRLLEELERRQLFTERIDEQSYRYHAVLLSYLDARLVELWGVHGARAEHQKAAALLEREGLLEDAAAAHARAEDWDGVARTLGHPDGAPSGLRGAWLEALPPTVVETDAMLLMARARRSVSSGALSAAVDAFRAAERVAASTAVAEQCRRDRDRVGAWLTPDRPLGSDWLTLLRGASQRRPLDTQRVAAALPDPSGRFAEGMSAFLAGDMLSASRILRGVANDPDVGQPLAAGARLVTAGADALCGRLPDSEDLIRLRDEIEQADTPWLDRIGRAGLAAIQPHGSDVLADLGEACRRDNDRWGEAIVVLLSGIGRLWQRLPARGHLERAARLFSELGAGVPEAHAIAYLALSGQICGDLDLAARSARQASTLAASLDVPGVAGVAALVLWRLGEDDGYLRRAKEILGDLGTWEWYDQTGNPLPDAEVHHAHRTTDRLISAQSPVVTAATPSARLRCLGGFTFEIGGRSLNESTAKPMERLLLHLLCVRAGERIHREALIEALWPEADPDAGLHRLQVAVSALRRLLGSEQTNHSQLLIREGDSYRLALPDDADVDVWRLEAALRRARTARAGGDIVSEADALLTVLAAYSGPLLPGDGPLDWVVDRREQLKAIAADAAVRLAGMRLQGGDPAGAAEVARAGLVVDRFRDELWKVLIEAATEAGHHAEAGNARKSYAAVLDELGVAEGVPD